MSAAAASLLAEATAAGARPRLAAEGRVRAPASAPPALLARLREHKAELATLLSGDACRRCGAAMGWPAPVGVVLGDGTAMHHACYELSEVERLRRRARNALSRAAKADKAEVLARRIEP